MRPIKFRAWDKRNGQMLEGFDNWRVYELFDDEDIIPLQFTGLLDKNGKEIYEDDFVDTGTKKGRVKFLFGCWHFVDGESAYLLYPKEEGYGSGGKWKFVEVMGNIYENPELTKQQ